MATIINPIITDAGLAAAIAADGSGLTLDITHVAIGTGGYDPDGTETALVDRRETVTISGGSIPSPGMFSVSVLFKDYVGAGYSAKEIGFYAGDPDAGGTLFAVYSSVDELVYRALMGFIAQFSLTLSSVPTGSVTVVVDPDAAILGAMLESHRVDPEAHPAYAKVVDVDSAILSAVSASAIAYFARDTAPVGWLKANGASLSAAAYPALFAAMGTMFGSDGAGNFNLPDLRGEFIRGYDDGRGIDAGRLNGSFQGGQNESHTHTGIASAAGSHSHFSGVYSGAPSPTTASGLGLPGNPGGGINTSVAGDHTHALSLNAAGGSEARPRNVVLLACIKY